VATKTKQVILKITYDDGTTSTILIKEPKK